MKKLFYLLLCALCSCNKPERKPDGKYEILSTSNETHTSVADTVRTIALLKDGYWVSTSFTDKIILRCAGGVYFFNKELFIQQVNFNTQDTVTIGKKYTGEYKQETKHLIAHFLQFDKNKEESKSAVYKKSREAEPLKNAALEGTWIMKPGQGGYNANGNEIIRIFAYPSFARIFYNSEKHYVTIYGGTYEFDGTEMIETIEYSDSQLPTGSTIEWTIKKLADKQLQFFDIDSFNDEEIFEQVNN